MQAAAEVEAKMPDSNQKNLVYYIQTNNDQVNGYIEYRSDGVFYNLHLKDACLRRGKTIKANYVIWVSTGIKRNE